MATPTPHLGGPLHPEWVSLVHHKTQQLGFGTVLITVHDGRVVQIDCTERTRIETPRNTSPRTEGGSLSKQTA